MNFLYVYKNGELYGQKLSVQHLINTLERKYLDVNLLKETTEKYEIARIQADDDIYQVYEKYLG